jgi:hypothetical protein
MNQVVCDVIAKLAGGGRSSDYRNALGFEDGIQIVCRLHGSSFFFRICKEQIKSLALLSWDVLQEVAFERREYKKNVYMCQLERGQVIKPRRLPENTSRSPQ